MPVSNRTVLLATWLSLAVGPLACWAEPAFAGAQRTDRYGDPLPAGAIARLGTVRLRQADPITALAFSPDGKVLASGGRDDGVVQLWDAATGKELSRFLGHQRPVASPNAHTISGLAFLQDGKTVASIDGDRGIRLWEAASGKEVRRIGGQFGVQSLAVSPDGKLLVSGGWDNLVRLWDPATGQELGQLAGHQQPVLAVAVSPDGKLLASGGDDPAIRLWDVETKKERGRLEGSQGRVKRLAFLPDGKTLLSGGEDNAIRLWDLGQQKEVRRFPVPFLRFSSLALSPDGKTVAAVAGQYGKPCLWDVATGAELRRLEGDCAVPGAMAFSPDGRTLAAGGHEHTIHVWEVAGGKEVFPLESHQSPVRWVGFCNGGHALASRAWWQGFVYLWDPSTGKQLRRFVEHQGRGSTLAVSPEAKVLVAGRKGLTLWDIATGKMMRQLQGAPAAVDMAAFSPGGRLVAAVRWNEGPVRLWQLDTGEHLRECQGRPPVIGSLAFSPDGKLLAVAGTTETVVVWDAATGKHLRQFAHPNEDVSAIAFSPDGRMLATGGTLSVPHGSGRPAESRLRLWEVATAQERRQFAREPQAISAVAFSADGRVLGAGGSDHTIRLWDAATGEEVRRLAGHRGGVRSVAFSPDGKWLASGSGDTTGLVWDVSGLRGEKASAALSREEFDLHWRHLAGPAGPAFPSITALAASPKESVGFLSERLRPARPPDERRLAQLVADLEGDAFATRDRATKELEQLGDLAEPALRKALEKSPALEGRRRVERLLAILQEGMPPGDSLRELRAVEALERVATPEARQLLQKLAAGAPAAGLTREAKVSLERLARRDAGGP
jgi:WD40 repeat protein